MMLSKSLLSSLFIVISFTTQVGGNFMDDLTRGVLGTNNNDQQHHRALDSDSAVEDCVTATIDLIDPVNNVSGLWFFPNYLVLNSGICNLTTAICDYNGTDYGEQAQRDCDATEGKGKIVKKDVRICLDDVSKTVSKVPAFADLDFINVEFCLAQSCDENIPIVQLHRALYNKAEQEKAPGTENPYASLEASSKGLCLPAGTFPPSPSPSDEKTSGAFGGISSMNKFSSWIIVGVMTTLLFSNGILG